MKKKTFYWLILAVVLVGVLLSATRSAPDRDTLIIGVTAPQTGNLAFLGENYREGIELAMKEVLHDYPAIKLKVIFEDDGFDPVKAVSAVKKLINTDGADVIFSFGSPVGNAVSPITEKTGIPHINSIASDPNVAKGDWNFVHWTPPYKESALMASELRKRDIKTAVLFEQNQPGVQAVTHYLKEDLPKAGVTIVATEKYDGNTTDFRSMIAKVKNIKADIYLLEATSASLEILARQIREAGIQTAFTSVESFEFSDNPELFDGNWYISAADQSPEFIAKYQKEYGKSPKLGAGNGYDSIKLIVKAVSDHGSSKEAIRQALLATTNYKGAMGTLSVDSEGIVVSEANVKMIKEGKSITL